MKLNKEKQFEHNSFYMHYQHPLIKNKMGDSIISQLPHNRDIVVMCIGTDRSTGDALGPLTGSLFNIMNPTNLRVYGTLHKPIHAVNLRKYMKYINNHYKNPYIVAIDASLGKSTSIGSLITGLGPIKPGAAVNKELPPVGDMHLIAVVNINSLMGHAVLQSTRLSLTYDMATTIAQILSYVDQSLSFNNNQPHQNIE